MAYIGNAAQTAFTSFDKQTITGDGTAVYTLSHAVANDQEVEVFVNNVRQEGGSGKAYTVSGNQITFSENIASTDDCYVVFQGKALQTVVPPDGSVTSAKFAAGLVLGGGSYLGDSGGGTADIFRVHESELNTSVTIPANNNALCAGALTLATGVTVTVNGNLVIA
jgi:hypothetical protein